MNRIVIVGSTGSGKTTLAARLAEALSLHHVELDALHWDPSWTPASTDLFRQRVERAIASDRWDVDGNYRKARDLVWARADTLDLSPRETDQWLAGIVKRAERIERGIEGETG